MINNKKKRKEGKEKEGKREGKKGVMEESRPAERSIPHVRKIGDGIWSPHFNQSIPGGCEVRREVQTHGQTVGRMDGDGGGERVLVHQSRIHPRIHSMLVHVVQIQRA